MNPGARAYTPEEYTRFKRAQDLAEQAQALLHEAMEEIEDSDLDNELNTLALAFMKAGSVKRALRRINREASE